MKKTTAQLAIDLLKAMQADATKYLEPGNECGVDWFVNRMLWHQDGPQQRAVQAALEAEIVQSVDFGIVHGGNWRNSIKVAPIPVLYTDSICGDQVQRDDVWIATTSQISALQEPAAPAWHPIETAPKDGTSILVYPATYNGRSSSIASWNTQKYHNNPKPYWDHDDCHQVTMSRQNPPTHWMPLPPAPWIAS